MNSFVIDATRPLSIDRLKSLLPFDDHEFFLCGPPGFMQGLYDALRELVLPQTEVLVGSHQTLTDFLLPDWDQDRPASPRELAVGWGQAARLLVRRASATHSGRVAIPMTK